MYNLFSNVKSDREFSATTGLSKVEFYELVYEFEEVESQQKAERLASGGTKEVLSEGAQRLFLLLYYLKTCPSFDVSGLSFGIEASTAGRYVLEQEKFNQGDVFKEHQVWVDLAYVGFGKYYKTKKLHLPYKKPRKSKTRPDPKLTDFETV